MSLLSCTGEMGESSAFAAKQLRRDVSNHHPRMGPPGNNGGAGSEGEQHGDLMVAEPRTKPKRPPLYKVILLNDDYTPMDFVVTVLEQIFRKTHEEAIQLMLQVHEKGAAICGVFTRDVAETKVDQVIEYARINDYPLQCALEPE